MAMGKRLYTQHAFLVAWGHFAGQIGLLEKLADVAIERKVYSHTPQAKVAAFLVAHLAGLEHLQDWNKSAHPPAKDTAVAQAWGQEAWPDYTGISRLLRSLTWQEAEEIVQVLQSVSQPFIDREIRLSLTQKGFLQWDADLTGIPVSNGSRSFPNASYGHMDNEIRLGYQAALVSMESPTYGRLWLSVAHHPGNTVSSTQAEALVRAAEERTGVRPRRRTELLRERIYALEEDLSRLQANLRKRQQALEKAQVRLEEAQEREQACLKELFHLEQEYRRRSLKERPHSKLARARRRYRSARKKLLRRKKALQRAQRKLLQVQKKLQEQQSLLRQCQERLAQYEKENAANPEPVKVAIRLDAGFGTYENIALLIEMGYEVYTKAFSHRVVEHLKKQVGRDGIWVRIGANAEMVVRQDYKLKGCPYPVDVALERFHTGRSLKYGVLIHFGEDEVCEDPVKWFRRYNGRQSIEAGIKENKRVFYLHRIKVRSEPAIYLQEWMVIFCGNFIRWAMVWLDEQSQALDEGLDVKGMGFKRQVKVGAHTSAWVEQSPEGVLLRFSEQSVFAGKVLRVPIRGPTRSERERKSPWKFSLFRLFSMIPPLIAQPLG